jgi:cob(I)alamin adenosyltransferase
MAIRITRVYTRTGDRGTTGLVGGRRVAKDGARVEAYGTVDELNSWVGLARAQTDSLASGRRRTVVELLEEVQQQLFDLGAQLATPPDLLRAGMPQVGDRAVKALERTMDRLQRELTPLSSFVLPGGGALSATLHLCRAVCRRAERETIRLARAERIGGGPVIYLNRLSDLFFVLARWVGRHRGERELLWRGGRQKKR